MRRTGLHRGAFTLLWVWLLSACASDSPEVLVSDLSHAFATYDGEVFSARVDMDAVEAGLSDSFRDLLRKQAGDGFFATMAIAEAMSDFNRELSAMTQELESDMASGPRELTEEEAANFRQAAKDVEIQRQGEEVSVLLTFEMDEENALRLAFPLAIRNEQWVVAGATILSAR